MRVQYFITFMLALFSFFLFPYVIISKPIDLKPCSNCILKIKHHKGQVAEGKFNPVTITGEGTFYYENGEIYNGYIEKGKKIGPGKMTYPDGSDATCEYRNDRIEGLCVRYFLDKKIVIGKFLKGVPHGSFTLKYPNGNYFTTEYVNGVLTGTEFANILYESGEKYMGDWRDGMRNGSGFLCNASGELIFAGKWKDDKEDSENKKDKLSEIEKMETCKLKNLI